MRRTTRIVPALLVFAVSAAGVAPPVRAGIEYNLTVLGTLGGAVTYSAAVNDSGQVTGYSYTAGGAIHAFLSGPGGGALMDLGTLPGGESSGGQAVNASGQVAGSSSTASGPNHAFLSGPGGGALKDLGDLGGGFSQAYAVNASGQVAGLADVPTGGGSACSTRSCRAPAAAPSRTSAPSAGTPTASAMP